jgi:hypothetical protein
MKEDKELQEFRNLMRPPDEYHDGFGWGTVLMALFVGLVMAPSQLYMVLVAGVGMGPAAKWVTVILYVEIARRAFKKLKRPEIFILFYMCSAMMATGGRGLLWRQFLVQSVELRKLGISDIPGWFAPSDPDVLNQRNFFMADWTLPLILMCVGMFIGKLDHFGLGYLMYRLTSDVEELPFPMAPVGAMGMTALADASDQRETWRWRTFSIGGAIGIAFGFVYFAVPNITSAIFSEPIRPIPLPFVDLTNYTEGALPAMPVMISFNLGFLITGMVMPFWAMVGSFIGLLVTLVANPVLYHTGVLGGWDEGLGAIRTIQSNTMDFYFSFGLGLALAVAIIGFVHLYKSFREKRREMGALGKTGGVQWHKLFAPPPGRGDIPVWVGLLIYFISTCTYIGLTYWLVNYMSGPLKGDKFPLWILLGYGFVYTPIISYVSSRMEGIIGRQVAIPYVREATFILSGYKGSAIWFAPIPFHNYAGQVVQFRTAELTGTRFRSMIKADVLILPILIVGTILFSQFIWSIGTVPSEMFPYANKFWELQAFQQGLLMSATSPEVGSTAFENAFKPEVLTIGFGLALGVYAMLAHFGLPVFLVYGVVRGLDQTMPHAVIPMFIGALLGRFVFRKMFGEKWPKYRIVFLAGFTAGVGLIAMFSLGFVLMSKSVIKLTV